MRTVLVAWTILGFAGGGSIASGQCRNSPNGQCAAPAVASQNVAIANQLAQAAGSAASSASSAAGLPPVTIAPAATVPAPAPAAAAAAAATPQATVPVLAQAIDLPASASVSTSAGQTGARRAGFLARLGARRGAVQVSTSRAVTRVRGN